MRAIYIYNCDEKSTATCHRLEYHGHLGFEFFFFQGGMIIQHSSLMTLKQQELRAQV